MSPAPSYDLWESPDKLYRPGVYAMDFRLTYRGGLPR